MLPAVAISSAVVGANLVGEGIREALALRQSLESRMSRGRADPSHRVVLGRARASTGAAPASALALPAS